MAQELWTFSLIVHNLATGLSPSVKYFNDRSKGVLLLWITCVVWVLCFLCFCVRSLLPCCHLLRRADLLALVGDVYCIFVAFPYGILGQAWYLIVSFPDLCCLSYFYWYSDKALSIKKGCYTFQWLENVDMHLYAKFDQNMTRGPRVMSTLTNC